MAVTQSKSSQDPQKIKLIVICAILFLAVSWIVYYQFAPRTPPQASGAKLEQINAETEQQKQELIQQQEAQPHSKKPKAPPAGA